MKKLAPVLTARTIAVLSAIVLIGSACGGGPGNDTGAADPVASSATPDPEPASVEAWVASVSDAWSQLEDELQAVSEELDPTDDTIDPLVELTRGEADIYEAFGTTLEQGPPGSDFDTATATFVTEIRATTSSLRQLADDMATDPDLQGSAIDWLKVGDIEDLKESLHDEARLACFPFQDAVAASDASLPLIDCGNSDQPFEFDIQPRGTGDLATGFQGDVEAGTYQFGEFARPFAVEFAEPISIALANSTADLTPIGDWAEPAYYEFWIVAPDDLPIPGTPYGPPLSETVAFPEDLGGWFTDSGLEIVAEGSTDLAGGTAPYWTVEVPDWTIETAGGGLAFAAAGDGPDAQAYPIRHNSTVWQVPHPGGPLVVIAPEKWEIPGHPDIDEITDLVATIVSTIVPIEGTGVTATTTSPPTEPNETNPATEDEVAMLREEVLGLEGFVTDVYAEDNVLIVCDTPRFELESPLTAGFSTDNAANGFNLEFLEFGSAADRDAHFAAIEERRSSCEALFELTFEREIVEADPGRLIIFSTTVSSPEGSDSFVSRVTTVGATGMLTINAANLDGVNALLAELGLA